MKTMPTVPTAELEATGARVEAFSALAYLTRLRAVFYLVRSRRYRSGRPCPRPRPSVKKQHLQPTPKCLYGNTRPPSYCPCMQQPTIYQIRIKGHLDVQWAAWFEGLTITLEENGETLLTGPVLDQAALHGLLRKVRDLGVQLISVNRVNLGRGAGNEY